MADDYLERQTEAVQDEGSPSAATFGGDGRDDRRSAGTFLCLVRRLLCGLWISLLLVLWPSSDWIGLLVLSQALLAAAYLLKHSSERSMAKASSESGPMKLARGGDHAH